MKMISIKSDIRQGHSLTIIKIHTEAYLLSIKPNTTMKTIKNWEYIDQYVAAIPKSS